ncbi:DUF2996 domain-containing protein [Microcoleus sp. FACHB-672]|uniref:DUF2996 domain-containing protein n=1 Tax=Microcoleus sp. FACHB-672 TaxID=2692825 RepID=UPI001684D352|nr:DUF2996 domain-containing protein [Microcoleus sp. FACHB-672]MBD2041475.1 DUF2996 domain-containing protein [Microcoleus sp. FACHB-672]
MAEETNYKEAGEQPPSTVEQQAPSVSEEHAPSTSEEQATDLPSANMPDAKAVQTEQKPAEAEVGTTEPTPKGEPSAKPPKANAADKPAAGKKAAEKADGEEAPAKAAKKEKAPGVEDKPFADFMHQDCLPALKTALNKQGISDVDISLEKQKYPGSGLGSTEECWQVIGRWKGGKRQFNVYFPKADIQGPRAFSCADSGAKASTIEPFLIDERKVTLDLLVFGVVQRLNAQKWLALN